MDRSSKSTKDGATKKEEHNAIRTLQEGIEKSVKNIASYMKTRNGEDALLKSKQEEKFKIQEEIVNMKGKLRYDSVQMPSIETNLHQIDEKKKIIEDYMTKIKTTLPHFSEASIAIKDKLLQLRNYIDESLSTLEVKIRDTEKERALLEERKQEVEQKFQEALNCLNSNGLNVTANLKRLKTNKQRLQVAVQKIGVVSDEVTQKMESVSERKAQLKKQLDDKQQRHYELLREVGQQKVTFDHIQREQDENLTNIFEKIQEKESEHKTLELEKVKNEGLVVNMLKELEVKGLENCNLNLKNDELAITLNQTENKIGEDNKKMEVELSSKLDESEKSKNVNKELEAVLSDFEEQLVLVKQAKIEIDLKIEDQKRKVEELKVEFKQLQKLVQKEAERIEHLTEEFSVTQGETISVNEELSKQKKNENMKGEAEIKEIELEIETMRKKNDEEIAEMIRSNNQLVTEFEDDAKGEVKRFQKESREIDDKIRALHKRLDDDGMKMGILEEEIAEKDNLIEKLKSEKALLKPKIQVSPKPVISTIASFSQAPVGAIKPISNLKEVAPYSQILRDRSEMSKGVSNTQTPRGSVTRSVGLKEVDRTNLSVKSSYNKRRKFDEMSESSTDSVSYNAKTFRAIRQEQIKQQNMAKKK